LMSSPRCPGDRHTGTGVAADLHGAVGEHVVIGLALVGKKLGDLPGWPDVDYRDIGVLGRC
jgi:hypothetical protein